MNAKKVKQPTILEVAHEMAKDLFEVSIIDADTMREFDTLCFTPMKNDPSQKTVVSLKKKEKLKK